VTWYYSIEKTAKIMGVDKSTVYRFLNSTALTACRLHPKAHMKVLAVDVHAFMQYHYAFKDLTANQQQAILTLVQYEQSL
jgi:DNA-binding LacI/PurR family transcriptional regulator|tara:strand:+ start:86 stop:325 length:240 start_codon:yes stop_codon:yes gene_type:complete